MNKLVSLSLSLIFFLTFNLIAQTSDFGINIDTVKAQRFDMGKMWTFENPPLNYFEETYGFKPTQGWLDTLQKAALKFGNGCTASFESADGLIMTNHHCVRGLLPNIQNEGEDLLNNGFYAATLKDERKIPGLVVDQLLFVKDITDEIKTAMDSVENDSAKISQRDKKLSEIKENYYKQNPDLWYKVVSLYEGGKFSLYGYKRYSDIRLVFVPELWVAKLGGDYDNFTYPRYGLDCAFLRAYDDDGTPVKCNYYFRWSEEPVYKDEPVFVVGNPGKTDRIHTIAQIKYARDFYYPMLTSLFSDLYKILEKKVKETNAEDTKLVDRLYSVGNALKVYSGTYKALLDPYLMARKKDFEKNFKNAVQSDPELNKKYGQIWKEIEDSRKQVAKYANELFAYNINPYWSPSYLIFANNLVGYARNFKISEMRQDSSFTKEDYLLAAKSIWPENFDDVLEKKKVLVMVNMLVNDLGVEHPLVKHLLDGKTGNHAVEYLLSKSRMTSKETLEKLADEGADSVLNSDDPFIYFVIETQDRLNELQEQSSRLHQKDEINNQLLGEALYKVYGESIPPDATGTLRIADGIVKGYDYNGTHAPYKTTFYGSLDRYYSFDKKFPFNLPKYWESLPGDFDLSTPLDFVSTNDIIGGNSGSAMLNKEGKVIGLAFDGNIESLPGNYIYTTEANRTVGVTVSAMLEAMRHLYKTERLYNEIVNGKIN